MSNQPDTRFINGDGFEVRAIDHGNGKRTIEGYGIVFNKRTHLFGKYHEVIKPSAGDYFQRSDINVMCCRNHNFDLLLGRSTAGTLRFEVDSRGVKYICDLPNNSIGDDTFESVNRGDYDGSSFIFRASNDTFIQETGGTVLREVNEFEIVKEMGPVSNPQYTDTSVTVSKRTKDNFSEHDKTELEKRQAIQQEHIKRAHAVREVRLAALFPNS